MPACVVRRSRLEALSPAPQGKANAEQQYHEQAQPPEPKKRLEKLDYKPVRAELVSARSRKRTRDALPNAIAAFEEKSADLLKQAKGTK
jgi:hypothetical protein